MFGIMPVSELFMNNKDSSDVRASIVDGMVPTNELFPKLRYFNEVISPIAAGMVLPMKLDPESNLVILPKLPISEGKKPESPSLSMSISSTLA